MASAWLIKRALAPWAEPHACQDALARSRARFLGHGEAAGWCQATASPHLAATHSCSRQPTPTLSIPHPLLRQGPWSLSGTGPPPASASSIRRRGHVVLPDHAVLPGPRSPPWAAQKPLCRKCPFKSRGICASYRGPGTWSSLIQQVLSYRDRLLMLSGKNNQKHLSLAQQTRPPPSSPPTQPPGQPWRLPKQQIGSCPFQLNLPCGSPGLHAQTLRAPGGLASARLSLSRCPSSPLPLAHTPAQPVGLLPPSLTPLRTLPPAPPAAPFPASSSCRPPARPKDPFQHPPLGRSWPLGRVPGFWLLLRAPAEGIYAAFRPGVPGAWAGIWFSAVQRNFCNNGIF